MSVTSPTGPDPNAQPELPDYVKEAVDKSQTEVLNHLGNYVANVRSRLGVTLTGGEKLHEHVNRTVDAKEIHEGAEKMADQINIAGAERKFTVDRTNSAWTATPPLTQTQVEARISGKDDAALLTGLGVKLNPPLGGSLVIPAGDPAIPEMARMIIRAHELDKVRRLAQTAGLKGANLATVLHYAKNLAEDELGKILGSDPNEAVKIADERQKLVAREAIFDMWQELSNVDVPTVSLKEIKENLKELNEDKKAVDGILATPQILPSPPTASNEAVQTALINAQKGSLQFPTNMGDAKEKGIIYTCQRVITKNIDKFNELQTHYTFAKNLILNIDKQLRANGQDIPKAFNLVNLKRLPTYKINEDQIVKGVPKRIADALKRELKLPDSFDAFESEKKALDERDHRSKNPSHDGNEVSRKIIEAALKQNRTTNGLNTLSDNEFTEVAKGIISTNKVVPNKKHVDDFNHVAAHEILHLREDKSGGDLEFFGYGEEALIARLVRDINAVMVDRKRINWTRGNYKDLMIALHAIRAAQQKKKYITNSPYVRRQLAAISNELMGRFKKEFLEEIKVDPKAPGAPEVLKKAWHDLLHHSPVEATYHFEVERALEAMTKGSRGRRFTRWVARDVIANPAKKAAKGVWEWLKRP